MYLTELIEIRPGVRKRQAVLRRDAVAVHDVLDYLASAMTAAEFVADFPELSELHLRTALEFAGLRERRLAAPACVACDQIAAALRDGRRDSWRTRVVIRDVVGDHRTPGG